MTDEKPRGAEKAAAAPKPAVRKSALAWAADKGVADWLLNAASVHARLTHDAWKSVDQSPCDVCDRTCESPGDDCDRDDPHVECTPRPQHACKNVVRTDAWSIANAWMTTPITEAEFDAAVDRAR